MEKDLSPEEVRRILRGGSSTLPPSKPCSLLIKKGQIILFGPPGTGKTYNTRRISVDFVEGSTMDNVNDTFAQLAVEGRIQFITFHPSYSYEEFVEGITVKLEKKTKKEKETSIEDSKLDYYLKDGLFKVMVKDALRSALGEAEDKSIPQLLSNYESKMKELTAGLNDDEKNKKISEWWSSKDRFVLIIDEINRGDMSKILGELITLLEADKRLGMENELIVTLPYSQQPFSVPPNLFIIGTMNTADKSIALLDVALRRRFGFVEMPPNLDLLGPDYVNKRRAEFGEELSTLFSNSVEALKSINARIAIDPTIGRDKCIGHAFLFKVQDIEDLLMVWNNEIVPMLEEYCYGRYSGINKLVFGKETSGWFTEQDGFKQLDKTTLGLFLGEIPGAKRSG